MSLEILHHIDFLLLYLSSLIIPNFGTEALEVEEVADGQGPSPKSSWQVAYLDFIDHSSQRISWMAAITS